MLGAIADDITGGTDLASVLRRRGLRVVQTIGLPPSRLPRHDAVVVSLKTRTAPVDTAISETVKAAESLLQLGAGRVFFKYCSTFDSTDEGNIGPAIGALQQHLGAAFTIACPAYPALGRTVYAGHLFVGRQLLSDSPMRHHPLTPMTDANLVRVLSRQTRAPVGLIDLGSVERGADAVRDRIAEFERNGTGVAIVDAILDRHIDTIAEATGGLRLVTGGAALGGAIPLRSSAVIPLGAELSVAAVSPAGRIAILSGSCSAATQQQVAELTNLVPSRRLEPLSLMKDNEKLRELIDWAVQQSQSGPVMVHSTDSPEHVSAVHDHLGRESAANLTESAFGAIAAALAADGVRRFIVAGGETSGAVLQALGIRALSFGDEIDPGIPWTLSIDPPGYALALKSGNFGRADFFARAMSTVDRDGLAG